MLRVSPSVQEHLRAGSLLSYKQWREYVQAMGKSGAKCLDSAGNEVKFSSLNRGGVYSALRKSEPVPIEPAKCSQVFVRSFSKPIRFA
jgi:hypothetical protein